MSRTMDTTIELLAPVGSPEALTAAVRCGADAVYLGAGSFHARQSSQPFDEATLREAVSYCHAHGVKVHLTLNTLIREEEFEQALGDAARAAEIGVDALIVQDRGLAAAIRRAAPALVLHASTQLTCHTPAGVKKLQQEGFSRVVLAREMSREEIAACCAVGCEIETFVHGALCMSVSGQCLLSAMLGGRSGNRGRCAQPCRLPFAVGAKPRETDRALSLKDLSLCDAAQELASLGVCSLKIEGRMKRPEYVAAAVSVCRAAIDGKPIDPQLADDLRAVFSRSGFTDGYYTSRRDIHMFGSRTKDDVTAAPAAQKRLAQLYLREQGHIPVDLALFMTVNEPMTLVMTDGDGNAVTVSGETPREGTAAEDRLKSALQKLGGTPFVARELTVSAEDGTDAPLSAVNALRREAVEKLTALRAQPKPTPFAVRPRAALPPVKAETPQMLVRLQTASQWSESVAKAAALIVLPLDTPHDTLKACAAHGRIAVEVPRGMFGKESHIQRRLREAKEAGAAAAMAHNVGALPLCEAADLPAIGGFGLYTMNAETMNVHAADGLKAATLSPELTARQMRFAEHAPLAMTALVYGRLPLMLLRNCPASAKCGCKACRQDRVLIDRKGVTFPLVCAGGCADLLNCVPLYLLDRLSELPVSLYTLYMTTESRDEVARVAAFAAEAMSGHPVPAEQAMRDGFTRGIVIK